MQQDTRGKCLPAPMVMASNLSELSGRKHLTTLNILHCILTSCVAYVVKQEIGLAVVCI